MRLYFRLVVFSWIVLTLANCTYTPLVSNAEELKSAVQRFEEVRYGYAAWRDVKVFSEVATGHMLANWWRFQSASKTQLPIAHVVQIRDFSVLEAGPITNTTSSRIAVGWHLINPVTQEVIGPCHAEEYTEGYILVKENNVWKVAGAASEDLAERHPVDDTKELRALYCAGE